MGKFDLEAWIAKNDLNKSAREAASIGERPLFCGYDGCGEEWAGNPLIDADDLRELFRGKVLVPVKPTEQIRQAMYMAQHYDMSVVNPDEWGAVDKAYAAMIAAAQEQSNE